MIEFYYLAVHYFMHDFIETISKKIGYQSGMHEQEQLKQRSSHSSLTPAVENRTVSMTISLLNCLIK